MFTNFTFYVEFLSKKELTPHLFAICWLIYHKDIKNIKLYQDSVGKFIPEDFDYLIEKGYILSSKYKNTENLHIGELMVTPLFSEEILIRDEFEALEELLKVYPKFFMINGKKQLTTACDLDALARIYFKMLKGDKIQHKIIIEKTKIVKTMMENGELNSMKIDKYIKGKGWSAAELKGENTDLRKDL